MPTDPRQPTPPDADRPRIRRVARCGVCKQAILLRGIVWVHAQTPEIPHRARPTTKEKGGE